MAVDKKRLEQYVYHIFSLLKQEDFYGTYMEGINKGNNKYELTQRFQKKKFDLDWIETIEECIVPLDTIVRNPRKFIVVEEDIVDISLARSISTESVKHLAQHTNLISSVDKNGMVLPNKILNTSKEESYEIYENRFIYTLLLKLHQFITRRTDMIKAAGVTSDTFQININSEYSVGKSNIKCKLETRLNMPLDEMLKTDDEQLTDVERIAKITMIVNSWMGSPFAKQMVSCALVRPPIVRTNVILKDPNFKKALVLWQFLDSYGQLGYEVKSINETADLPPANQDKFNNVLYINNLLIESIVRERTSELDVVGEEEEKKEKVVADEYVTKNIDDFVPDDFPQLKLSLYETKRVFTKIPQVNDVTREEAAKISRALDRVLLQYKINKAKQDSDEQTKLMYMLEKQEQKAKVIAMREAKEAEKIAERNRKRAEAEHRKQEKLSKQLERDRLERENAERIRIEEEANMKQRLIEERKAAEQRILEENERLRRIYESERARIQLEKQQLKEQLEREKRLTYIEPVEGDAMLKLRKREQERIQKLREDQEIALKEMITAHYKDLEAQQKQAILDMEQLADLCKYDIFDSDITPDLIIPEARIVPESIPQEEAKPDVEENALQEAQADKKEEGKKADSAESADPTLARSKITLSSTAYAPRKGKTAAAFDDDDEDIMMSGIAAPIDATAKWKTGLDTTITAPKIVRPSVLIKAEETKTATSTTEDDEWDLPELEEIQKKAAEDAEKEAARAAEIAKASVTVGKKITEKDAAPQVTRTFVPRSYTTIKVDSTNLDDVLKDEKVAGNVVAPEEPKKSFFDKFRKGKK